MEGNQVKLSHAFNNKELYVIETEKANYVVEDIVLGSVVMYNGRLNWLETPSSFPQHLLNDLPDLWAAFEENSTKNWQDLDQETAFLTIQNNQAMYESAYELFGDNFVSIDNIETLPEKINQLLAICEQKNSSQAFLEEQKKEFKEMYQSILDKKEVTSIGLFFDPKMNKEVMPNSETGIALLQKKETEEWSPEEKIKLIALVQENSLSPTLVHKLLQKYGGLDNIYRIFGFKIPAESYSLEYLFWKYKGKFYQTNKILNQHFK